MASSSVKTYTSSNSEKTASVKTHENKGLPNSFLLFFPGIPLDPFLKGIIATFFINNFVVCKNIKLYPILANE